MAYTEQSTGMQEPVYITEFDETARPLCDKQEVESFLDAIDYPFTPGRALWQIITAYEKGCIGAVQALGALEVYGCLTSPDELMDAFCLARRLDAGLPAKPAPEPPMAVRERNKAEGRAA